MVCYCIILYLQNNLRLVMSCTPMTKTRQKTTTIVTLILTVQALPALEQKTEITLKIQFRGWTRKYNGSLHELYTSAFPKFHENPFRTFYVIALRVRHRQTKNTEHYTSLISQLHGNRHGTQHWCSVVTDMQQLCACKWSRFILSSQLVQPPSCTVAPFYVNQSSWKGSKLVQSDPE